MFHLTYVVTADILRRTYIRGVGIFASFEILVLQLIVFFQILVQSLFDICRLFMKSPLTFQVFVRLRVFFCIFLMRVFVTFFKIFIQKLALIKCRRWELEGKINCFESKNSAFDKKKYLEIMQYSSGSKTLAFKNNGMSTL